MVQITLHFAPDSCARVPLIALEEIGCDYELEVVSFVNKQQRSAEYLALNPWGKVPTLVIDGRPLSENVAIQTWLAGHFPKANLLPVCEGALDRAIIISDLAFCASGLHPLVTRLRVPQFFCDTPDGKQRVFEMAEAAIRPHFDKIDARLAKARWWYGDHWSVLDVYINWVWFRVTGTAFDGGRYSAIARHNADLQDRPSVQRALKISQSVAEDLAAQGLAVVLDGSNAIASPFV